MGRLAAKMTARNAKSPARRGRLAVWREQHGWCARTAIQRLRARPLSTVLALAVMGLALSLPLSFALVLGNVRHVAQGLADGQGVSVFLRVDVDAAGAQALAARLRQRDDINNVTLKSPRQGAEELAKVQGFGAALDALGHNPLPWVLLVRPRVQAGAAPGGTLASALRALPQADLVRDQQAWRERARAILMLGSRTLWVLAGLMALAALLVVGTSVRQDIQSRADEVAILHGIGASRRFVQRPYLYVGAASGFGAGLVAVALALLVEWLLASPAARLVAAYGGHFTLTGLDPRLLLALPVLAALLGWLGAWLAARELQPG